MALPHQRMAEEEMTALRHRIAAIWVVLAIVTGLVGMSVATAGPVIAKQATGARPAADIASRDRCKDAHVSSGRGRCTPKATSTPAPTHHDDEDECDDEDDDDGHDDHDVSAISVASGGSADEDDHDGDEDEDEDEEPCGSPTPSPDRKSTRLNSSHT